MAAARAWAAGTLVAAPEKPEADDALADAVRWAASPEEIAGLRQHLSAPVGGVAVWRENAAIVAAFCAIGTQWRTTMAVAGGVLRTRYLGLDYAGAGVALAGHGFVLDPTLMTGLTVMELAARDALNGEVH